ncbi:AraC family transcriptional regulator N-terminal domain-containing protein [Anatilimnocola sp. NA78]|uniref:AraC family transcriptional regulator n=1 Tax=Anatilimnocola sp. NA78 TaxID=3415683 RepID=UPI003CE475D5
MSFDKLASFIERHIHEDGEYETAIPELALYRASSVTEHNASTYVPCLCVVAQGAKEIVLGGEPYRYDPSQSLLVSIDLPATSRVVEASPKRPCLVARVNLNLAVVGEMLAEHATAPTLKPGRALALAPMTPPLQDAVERLVALLRTPEDIRPLAPLILREIIYRLLTGPQGSRLRQIASTGAPAHRISKAIMWLKDHFTEPLIVEELAGRVGLAPSTLHLHFKNITAMSPLQYQKQLRLQEARRLLLAESLDAASAAYRVGYESPSQFSREYRRMFGAPPRQDVAAVKIGT